MVQSKKDFIRNSYDGLFFVPPFFFFISIYQSYLFFLDPNQRYIERKGLSAKAKVRYLKKDEKIVVLLPLPSLLDSKSYAEITEYIQQLNSPVLLGVSTIIPSSTISPSKLLPKLIHEEVTHRINSGEVDKRLDYLKKTCEMLILTMDTTEDTNNKEKLDAFGEIYKSALMTASIPSLLVELNLGEIRGFSAYDLYFSCYIWIPPNMLASTRDSAPSSHIYSGIPEIADFWNETRLAYYQYWLTRKTSSATSWLLSLPIQTSDREQVIALKWAKDVSESIPLNHLVVVCPWSVNAIRPLHEELLKRDYQEVNQESIRLLNLGRMYWCRITWVFKKIKLAIIGD